MVVFLLILSVLLLLIAVAMYRLKWYAIVPVIGVLALIGYGILWFSTRSLMLVFPCLLATWIVCRWRDASRKQFTGFAALSIAAGWIGAMLLFIPRWNEIQQLAADYPVERMDQRLAYERPGSPSRRSLAGSRPSLDDGEELMHYLEEEVSLEPWARNHRRSALYSLERTHDNFVAAFISQEGLGIGRFFHMPARTEHIVMMEPAPVTLSLPPIISQSSGMEDAAVSIRQLGPYSEFHLDQSVQFSNPQGFGAAIDGEWDYYGRTGATKVRGFEPHAFREIPTDSPAGDEWQLARLELVSLLKHDPPAAYLSEHLPRMQELASDDAPTRPLNAFETRSLKRLLDGETIVAEESRNRITMLGGLRAARQCLQCHSVGEGHLLGAFSYEFLRKEPLPPAEKKPAHVEPVT